MKIAKNLYSLKKDSIFNGFEEVVQDLCAKIQ